MAKVLSTTTWAPAAWAAAAIVATSATSIAGLVGDSSQTSDGVVAGRDHGLGVGDVDQLRRDPAAVLEVAELHTEPL